MSGRSAHVRIKNTKVKDTLTSHHDAGSHPSLPSLKESTTSSYTTANTYYQDLHLNSRKHHNADHATIRSASEKSDDGNNSAYARVKKVPTPIIEVSGIEKSSFRQMMDKKSEGFRKGITRPFGGKKKKTSESGARPSTSAAMHTPLPELDDDYDAAPPPPAIARSRSQQFREDPVIPPRDHSRMGHHEHSKPGPPPPQSKLPAIPEGAGLKQWTGSGRPPQTWVTTNLAHDSELWDPLGDTVVYLCNDGHKASRPPASFRVSSHVIEATESRYLIEMLRDGAIDDGYAPGMVPSPLGSGSRQYGRKQRVHPTPSAPDGSPGGWDAEVMYEMYFPAPHGLKKNEALRYQVATRNVFALLYQVSLVGSNLHEALCDLTERLAQYIPQEDVDTPNMVIDYVLEKGFDDVRENPSGAAALLAWSERSDVRWDEGWREGFVHAAGMITRVEASSNYKDLSSITKVFLEKASLEMHIRVQTAEQHLYRFEPVDMWPLMHAQAPPAQAAFQRLTTFFLHHYQSIYQTWPPPAPAAAGGDQWLSRNLVKKLQTDFGALYDYLVNREVVWDGSHERNGRKWNMKSPGNNNFDPDTEDLPLTDIFVAFDNRHKFAHIPHPYPLVPEPAPMTSIQMNGPPRDGRGAPRDRMAERKAALAYTESTNIYVLGTDFVNNALVEAFSKFEKTDSASGMDPFVARRGRWVLIYGILQVLSSVSVDTPHLRCKSDISYHLSPSLRGTPPWRPNSYEEANQIGSHCWTVRSKWNLEPSLPIRRGPLTSVSRNYVPSVSGYSESDAGSSYRSPIFTSASTSSRSANTSHHSARRTHHRLYLAGSNDQTPSAGYEYSIPEHRERETKAESRSASRAGRGGDDVNSQASSRVRSRAGSVKTKQRVELQKEFPIRDFDFERLGLSHEGRIVGGEDDWKL